MHEHWRPWISMERERIAPEAAAPLARLAARPSQWVERLLMLLIRVCRAADFYLLLSHLLLSHLLLPPFSILKTLSLAIYILILGPLKVAPKSHIISYLLACVFTPILAPVFPYTNLHCNSFKFVSSFLNTYPRLNGGGSQRLVNHLKFLS